MMQFSFSRQTRLCSRRIFVFGCIFLLGLGTSPAYANPFGGTVVAGQASIQVSGNTVTITQGSNRAVINWQDFSIGANQITRFNQNSSSAATLNRVTGGNPSAILGQLQANGQVFLINPNGIVVGPGAQINVGAFTASTLDIDNAQFMRGGALDFRGDSTAGVVNHGNITAVDGGIYLIGARVENHGLLNAPNGTVGLAAGQHVRLADSSKPHLVVKATSQSLGGTGVLNTGTINALRAELAANGGNVYGLAINNTGTIRATGVANVGGEVYLTSRGGSIQNTGNLIASGATNASLPKVVLDTRSLTGAARTGETLLAGQVDVSGTTGGVAHILGDHVSLTGATINASGLADGGNVLIGGGFQGQAIAGDDPLVNGNAITTTVDAASTINANAGLIGNGGQVIVWADDTTTYAGNIFARGGQQAGNGGFVEVSGLNTLTMGGFVSTLATNGNNGTLLLDPGNFDVNAGNGVSMANSIGANTLTGAGFLADNNVVIATHFTDPLNPIDADIRVNAPVIWNEATSLTFLAQGNFRAFASVQNGSAAGGDINVIAGWNGSTQMPGADGANPMASFDFDALRMTADSFGQNNGSAFIGTVAQTVAVSVGSRNGETNVAAYDVILQGGASAGRGAIAAAQIGFPSASSQNATGEIEVHALNDVRVLGGTASAHAQIGHGGRSASPQGDFAGMITVDAGNDVVLTGGPGTGTNPASYAQIGHVGFNRMGSQGNTIADISVTAGRDVSLSSGVGGISNYAQLGHGGDFNPGTRGSIEGSITVNAANNLSLDATAGGVNSDSSYVQVGHGGLHESPSPATISGNIDITVLGDASLTGGVQPGTYAQIGHGDASGGASGSRMGDIDIRIGGETSLVNGTPASAPWLIGHATTSAAGITNADVTLITGTLDYSTMATSTLFNIPADANGVDFAAKMIANLEGGAVTLGATNGTAGPTGGMIVASPFIYDSPNNLSFLSTTDIRFNASVQNGGATMTPGLTGEVNVVAGWDGSTGVASPLVIGDVFGDASSFGVNGGSVFIGNGIQTTGIAVGTRFGATNVAANSLSITGSTTTTDAFAQLGFNASPFSSTFAINGGIDVRLNGDLNASGGTVEDAFAQVGHGGNELDGNFAGTIRVDAVNLNFLGGSANDTYVHLGHGGDNSDGTRSGNIVVNATGRLRFLGGPGDDAYSQLGHGGNEFDGSIGTRAPANITVNANALTFVGGGVGPTTGMFDDDSYAQLGHGGENADGMLTGNILVRTAGNITFTGGGRFKSYAQLGNGGAFADGVQTGDITIVQANDIIFIAGTSMVASSQLGHGGFGTIGSQSGSIRINQANNIVFTGGTSVDAYAQLGHGGGGALVEESPDLPFGGPTSSNQSGNITILSTNNATFTAGSGLFAYSQLGHGDAGGFAGGSSAGDIRVILNDSASLTGTDVDAPAWFGHRKNNQGSVSGNLLLAVDQADPLSDGGGRLLMNNRFTAIDMDGSPNEVRIFDSRRDGPSPQMIAEGAIVNGVPFTNFPPASPGTLTAAGWRPNTEFTSWAHEQWGANGSEFTVVNQGPYTGPFTFFFLGVDSVDPVVPTTPTPTPTTPTPTTPTPTTPTPTTPTPTTPGGMMTGGSSTPEIPTNLRPIEVYWSWTAHEFLARTLFDSQFTNHTPQITSEESERPEDEIAGDSSP